MILTDPYHFPDSFYEFAFMPRFEKHLDALAELAEPEEWDYKYTHTDKKKPILNNYLKYTYKRIAEEKKIVVTSNESHSCWNTGLVTPHQESIFILFEKNLFDDRTTYWHFSGFARKGERNVSKFSTLPDVAHYFDDPSSLVFDTRKELRANIEHIIADNKERFPEDVKTMNDFGIQNLVKGAIDSAIERVKRNYKTAIPQYFHSSIQLLLPLCLMDAQKADLALAIEKFPGFYRAATCLTLDMAYNNARQLARPDRDWLVP